MNKKIGIILIITAGLLSLLFLYFTLVRSGKDTPQFAEPSITLYRSQENKLCRLELEEYIKGVVAAEMPASFETEALKAQAVAARTYTLRRLIDGRKYAQDADLSDNIYECQAYVTREEFADRHPRGTQEWQKKIEAACDDTRGEIMLYKGEPIDALYHSTCGGKTESAAEITGQDIAYLQSTKCNYCSQSNYYESVQVFSPRELQKLTGVSQPEAVKILSKTPSGRSKKLQLDNRTISAEEFRRILQLPSTNLNLKNDNKQLLIISKGYGHGLGMCQYGANGMASRGKSYRDILKKYYKCIEFYRMDY